MNQKEAAHARLRKIIHEQRNLDVRSTAWPDYLYLIHELLLAWIDRESADVTMKEL